MALVIDASVASMWLFEEAESSIARGLLGGEDPLVAPDLVVAEVANVAWKRLGLGEIEASAAAQVCDALGQLFDELVPLRDLATPAVEIAHALRHPVYDCFYLALAEARDSVMISADQKLLRRVAGTRWQSRLAPLASHQLPGH